MSRPAADAEADAAADLLGRLAPHLRQAFSYYRGSGGVAPAPTYVNATTEALGVAFVAVGFGRRVTSTNAMGRELLSLGNLIGLDGKGRISTRLTDIREALDRALDAAVRGEALGNRTITIQSGARERHCV